MRQLPPLTSERLLRATAAAAAAADRGKTPRVSSMRQQAERYLAEYKGFAAQDAKSVKRNIGGYLIEVKH